MSYPRVIFFGRTAWTDAAHFPCTDPGTCPYGHGTLPRPGSDSTLFGIRHNDRRRHLFIAGMTGMGKTSLLANLSLADIAAGYGVACIDPHGDWASSLLDAIPTSRSRDVVVLDPSDLDFPVGLNVFESVDPDWHFLVADQLISVFRSMWASSWGPRMENLFYNAVLSLLHVEGSTLLSVPRLLDDKPYRTWVTSQLTDPVLQRFWSHEYEPLSQTMQREAASPILNKVGQFLNGPVLRHMLGQRKPKLDFGEIMDGSRIFIANLAKGRIGDHNSMLLGSLLVTKFFLAALRRADRPEHERADFYLHIDEVHNLANNEMFANILSEARKYSLSLTAASQYLEALSARTRAAVFGNVGTIVAFRVGADDAGTLASEFAPHCQPADLQTLGRYEFYVKLGVDGLSTRPFPAVSLPPLTLAYAPQTRERILRSSRQRYGARREVVEDKIKRWLAHTPGKRPGPEAASKKAFVVT